MNEELKKDLLKYTAAATTLLAGNALQAQYQYTNIPDTTINTNNGFFDLDIDQDGTPDFRITQYLDTGVAKTTTSIQIQPTLNSNNRVAGIAFAGFNYPFNIEAATLIDSTTSWNGTGGNFNTGYMAFVVNGQANYPNSNWIGPLIDGYLGLEITKDGRKHYGWARIDVGDSSRSFTVKGFSINLTPDSAMTVGFELLQVLESNLSRVTFYVDNNQLHIQKPDDTTPLHVRIIDMNGRLIFKETTQEENSIFQLGNLSTGLYIVQLEQKGLLRSEKIFVR